MNSAPSGGFTEGVGYVTILGHPPLCGGPSRCGGPEDVEHPFWRNAGYYFIHLTSPIGSITSTSTTRATVVQETRHQVLYPAAAKRYQDPGLSVVPLTEPVAHH